MRILRLNKGRRQAVVWWEKYEAAICLTAVGALGPLDVRLALMIFDFEIDE